MRLHHTSSIPAWAGVGRHGATCPTLPLPHTPTSGDRLCVDETGKQTLTLHTGGFDSMQYSFDSVLGHTTCQDKMFKSMRVLGDGVLFCMCCLESPTHVASSYTYTHTCDTHASIQHAMYTSPSLFLQLWVHQWWKTVCWDSTVVYWHMDRQAVARWVLA